MGIELFYYFFYSCNSTINYTETFRIKFTDFRDLSEARFRVSHGTVLTKRFLYLLRATPPTWFSRRSF